VRGDDKVITDSDAAAQATGLEIEFSDGRFKIGGAAAAKSKRAKPKPPEQGSLF
jgi:exodeoxyribonuclease VII large subunit